MQIILLEKIRNLGDLGSKVEVKNGFARNYLIPQKKAVRATEKNIQMFEERRAELQAAADEILKQAQSRAEQLNALAVQIDALASDEGKLYGSVGPNEVAEAIIALGVEVEKREVLMPEGVIRETGEYDINLQLHSDVLATVKVIVGSEKA